MTLDSPDSTAEEAPLLANADATVDWFRWVCRSAGVACVALLFWIFLWIGYEASPAIEVHGLNLLSSSDWNTSLGRFGIFPNFMGTIISSVIALGVGMPLGVLTAVFFSEDFLPGTIRQVFRFLIELLASIPSVVYGLWGLAVVVPLVESWGEALSEKVGSWLPLVQGPVYGNSIVTASLVLAVMILPTITAISRSALQAVPLALREGGYALGATRWETIGGILLPTAAPGIVASAILALGRAMGETMAVAMLIGNSTRFSWSLFSPSGTLASLLANQFGEAQGMVVGSLMYAALVLIFMTLMVNLAGDWILRLFQRRVKVLL